jgi:D-alanyl-D-alanine carboxypeptidase
MGRRWCLVLILFFLSLTDGEARLRKRIQPKPYTPKYSSIVLDADTGETLHNEEADGVRHPASLTKMMTLYLVFEAIKKGRITLKTQMPVSAKASRQAPSKLGLVSGESISLKTAILGLVTKSANDAAVVVAEFLGGSEEAFARQMTQKARALGMSATVFRNASGLPNPAQVTSARDMAILSRALYRDYPRESKYFSLRSFTHKGVEHRNHNHLLGKVPGVDGIKTGFIGASGFNLAASAVRFNKANQPRRLITVVMGGENRHWRDRRVTELLELYFAKEGWSRSARSEVDSEVSSEIHSEISDVLNDLIYEQEAAGKVMMVGESVQAVQSVQPVQPKHPKHPKQKVFEKEFNSILEDMSEVDGPSDQQGMQKTLPANWVVPVPGVTKINATRSSFTKASPKPTLRTVQLSAVSSEKKAKNLAQTAAKKLGFGRSHVHKVRRGKRTLYSPQVTGIPAPKATRACRVLGNKCVVLA